MRLSFPNGEHPDVLLEEGEVSIGSAAGNRVVLSAGAISARHAGINADPVRGIVLNVLERGAAVHVNARPVREVAVLRLGDVVSLDHVQMLLKPDQDRSIDGSVPGDSRPLDDPAQRAAASRVVLRGVGGPWVGRSVNLRDPVTIGRAADAHIQLDDPDIPTQMARIEIHGDRVLLRALAGEGAVVNGVPVRDAVLHPGDQIAFDAHRFVLEAPGLPPRGAVRDAAPRAVGSTQTLQAVRADAQAPAAAPAAPRAPAEPDPAPPRFHYAWLIVAAALIAVATVLLIWNAPKV